MNEPLFFLHTSFLIAALFAVARFGRVGLSTFVVFCVLCANIFVIKQIDFFGLTITCSDPFTVVSFLSINLIHEWYGKDVSMRTLLLALLFSVIFLGASQLHLTYLPSSYDQTNDSFKKLFSFSPRIILSSVVVFFLSQRINTALFGWLKKNIHSMGLGTRLIIASLVAQLIDTLLFSFLALYGVAAHLLHIILVSFGIKSFLIIFSHPLTLLFQPYKPKQKDYV